MFRIICPGSWLDAEVMLVNAAGPLSVADTVRLVEYWKAAVDGPGVETGVEELEERRYLFAAKTFEGMVKLDGLLDPVTGDLVLTALGAAMPPPCRDDRRTARQRRADALADLARRFLDSGEASGTEKPHVLVLTDLDALQGHGGGVHETANGQVLTPGQVRRYACDCTISRIILGPDSEPLDIGRATRIIPPAMRRALIARDRHCQHPGCDRDHRWCDAHHIQHWADGGATSLSQPETALPTPPHPRPPTMPTRRIDEGRHNDLVALLARPHPPRRALRPNLPGPPIR